MSSSSSSSTSSGSSSTDPPPSFFPTYALDQAFCGFSAGIISTLVMHPLDLLKVRFQVSTSSSLALPSSSSTPSTLARRPGTLTEIYLALRDVSKAEGIRGLYRGLSPNIVGNASSWGLYFLWYTMIKSRKTGGDSSVKLSAGQHLAASAESDPKSEKAYKNVVDGLVKLATREGVPGLTKGMALALFGVSNGAIQFMSYEELKRWRVEVRRRGKGGIEMSEVELKSLSNIEYILMSGSAKLLAIGITYPYQVIRSRIQYQPPNMPPYTSIPNCISRTYAAEGLTGFYKGLATNAVRILPGTCVTFVCYEQISRLLARNAKERSGEGKARND
ncbi:mitochondrial FAD carrier protein [Pseudohyphozyma bogoriensis]|nr:mitochondrial FAD carrier protein [Pseudohyphozyma bogoriensis]